MQQSRQDGKIVPEPFKFELSAARTARKQVMMQAQESFEKLTKDVQQPRINGKIIPQPFKFEHSSGRRKQNSA